MKTMKRVITFLLVVVFCVSAAATAHAYELEVVHNAPFTGVINDGTRYSSWARVYCSTRNYWKYLNYGGVVDDTAISTTLDISFDNNAERATIAYCCTDSTGQTSADGYLHIYKIV